jgi:hypothetical protein
MQVYLIAVERYQKVQLIEFRLSSFTAKHMSTYLLNTSVLSCSFPINAPLKRPYTPNRLWYF